MDQHEKYINGLSEVIHRQCVNAGWWNDPERCLFTCIQLISTEIAEATEGARKNLMDDHLPQFKMEEVELADALIRTLDLGGKLGLEYSFEKGVPGSFCSALNSVGKQHLGLTMATVNLAAAIMDYQHRSNDIYKELMDLEYSDLVKSILQVARNRGYSFYEAMELKMEYNQTRPDHKLENRKKPHGKEF